MRISRPASTPTLLAGAAALTLLAACASSSPASDDDAFFMRMMNRSFRDQGIAKVERLKQDESDVACSRALGGRLPDAVAQAIESASLETVKMPADGKFIGDWKAGEQLAQNGRGMTWSDPSSSTAANGGNCYNCHQLSKSEISYGTLGPSLYNYGKLRGVTDPEDVTAGPVIEYTWRRLYNSKAFNACSNMPRFGHEGLLSESQMKDLMALLLDPKSPVNQ